MFAQVGWPGFWMFAVVIFLLLAFLTHVLPDSWWPDWYIRERGTLLSCSSGTLVTPVDPDPKFKVEPNTDLISMTIYLGSAQIFIDVPDRWHQGATITTASEGYLIFNNDSESKKPPPPHIEGEIDRITGVATIQRDKSTWQSVECRRRSARF
jgi:hypothetical protein